MVTVRTKLAGQTQETARNERFEPLPLNPATNVQQAIGNAVTQIGTARLPAFSVTVLALPTDVELGINTSTGAVTVSLPLVSAWAADNPNGLALRIFDYTGNAATHNIGFTLNGADTFLQGANPVIKTNNGGVALRPILGATNQWNIVALG